MNSRLRTQVIIALMTFGTFIITFLIFYRETSEPFSSFTAATLSALLVLGASIIIDWFIRVFTKS